MRRYIFPLLLGLVGTGILLSLGTWQLRRLEWKEAILADISAKLAAAPVPLAGLAAPDPPRDQYRTVAFAGRTTGESALVLSGRKGAGAGYEVIDVFELADGRRVLLDRGFVPEAARDAPRPPTALSGTGTLLWPNDADAYTPPPDEEAGLWFARDVAAMSAALGTAPLLVVLTEAAGDLQGVSPTPVVTAGIPNDHREYAFTWFSLAAIWAGMTGFLLWRIRQRQI